MSIRTAEYQAVEDFIAFCYNIEIPDKPNISDYQIDGDGFTRESDHLKALASSLREYENLIEEYSIKRRKFDEIKNQVFSDFKMFCTEPHVFSKFEGFCISKCLANGISEKLKSDIFAYAYNQGHSDGMVGVFKKMVEISDIANTVHYDSLNKTS